MSKGLKSVFGGGAIGEGKAFGTVDELKQLYDLLKSNGCETIDTARLYGNSEEWMGKTNAGDTFVIDSKTPGGFVAGESTGSAILQHAKETIQRLGIKTLDVYYIHSPDPSLDLEDMLKGINDAYKAGYFKRFGLSNYKAADVERVHKICKDKGYPVPSVYQGNYNAVARRQETELFPILRKYGIAFYAYSPIAGGFLAKSKETITGAGEDAGRFAQDHRLSNLYNGLYNKPSYLKALDLWQEAAQAAGVSRAELAYRWVAFDSPLDSKYGDAIIFGASKFSQVKETLAWLKAGSVGKEANAKIDEIWKTIEKDAPLDNYYN